MRGKILSSEYRVPDKLGPLRTLTLLFQHATCVKKTAHEYFVLGSQRYVLIAFKYFFFYFERLIESLDSVFGNA